MEIPQVVATVSTAIVGIQGMMRAFRIARSLWGRTRPTQEPKGVTIMNGEAKQLFAAVSRIEERQDRHGTALEHLGARMESVERRLAT